MSDDDVEVRFGASVEGFNASMAQVREVLQGLTEPVRGVRDNLGDLAEAFVAAFAIEKVVDFVKEVAELGEVAERTAAMLGLTVEQVTDLQFAAAVTGGSSEGMTRALEQLERAMSDAHSATSVQAAAFQSLGISTDFLKQHQNDLMGVLEQVSARFSETADGPAKTAIAMALLGRSGAEMIPLLDQGADGFAELKKQAQDAGVELSGPVAAGMAQTAENNNKLGQAWQGLGEGIMQIFKPAIDAIVTSMTSWIEGMTSSITQGGLLQTVLEVIAVAVDGVVAGLELFVLTFEEVWTVGEEIITALTKGLISLAAAMHDAVTLNWSAVGSDLNSGWQDQVDNFNATTKKMEDMAAATAANISKMFTQQFNGNAPGANSSGSPDDRDKPALKPPAQNQGGGANEAADAARTKVDGEITVLTEGLSRKQALLDSELQMHKITDAQWVQQSEDAINTEYQAEVAELQKELQLGGLKVTQRQEILNKIAELEQKHATDIQKIQQKAAADYQKTWTSVADTIASALNSQVSGLLKGTESIGQALENIGLDLATQAIENAIKSITASAAQSFASVFAWFAPTLGPAAAGPAAAAQATVMGVAGGLASFEVGTPYIPHDMMANLHAGEGIIPAYANSKLQSAVDQFASGAGGGDSITHNHFHGAILDGRELLRQLTTAKRLNPSLA